MERHPDWCDPAADGAALEAALAADPAQADQVVRTLRLESLLRRELRSRPSTGFTTRRRRNVRRPAVWWPSVVASAACLLLAAVWWRLGMAHPAAPVAAEPLAHVRTWPDGSRVELAAGARVREATAADQTALHLLAGALTATVRPHAPEKPFRVSTDQARVTVVGTVFTLACFPSRTELAVAQGRVHCALPDGTGVEVAAGGRAVALGDGSLVTMPPCDTTLWRLDAASRQAWEATPDGSLSPGGAAVFAAQPPARADALVFGVSAKAERLFAWDEEAELRFDYRADGPVPWAGVWILSPDRNGADGRGGNYYLALPTPPTGRWRSAAIPLAAIPGQGQPGTHRPAAGAVVRWLTIQAGWKPGVAFRVANLRLERPLTPRTGM